MQYGYFLWVAFVLSLFPGCQNPGPGPAPPFSSNRTGDDSLHLLPSSILSSNIPIAQPDTWCLLNYYIDQGTYYLLQTEKSGSTVYRLGPVREIDSLVFRYRQSILDKKAGRATGHLLLRKLLPAGCPPINHKLIITTAGALFYLPFETLIVDTTGCRPVYLLEYCPVLYRSSETADPGVSIGKPSPGKGLLCLAPDYSGSALPVLPFARYEARTIASGYKQAKVLDDQQASKTNFIREIGQYDMLHIAAHSGIHQNGRSLSYLYFHANNKTDSLSAREISQLHLQARLVVLSSCQTLCEQATQAGQETETLGRAFLSAGVRNLAGTTWDVPDKATAAILVEFYKNLNNGSDTAEALRLAKWHYLQKADALGAQPFFWGGLVLYGDLSPVACNKNDTAFYGWLALFTGLAGILLYIRRGKTGDVQ